MQAAEILKRQAMPLAAALDSRPKSHIILGSVLLAAFLGLTDYLLGAEISLGVFYAVPVVVTAWFVGPRSAFAIGMLSISFWILADYTAGLHYSRPWIPFLNGSYRLAFYVFLITILTRLRHLQSNLQDLAESRARALANGAARNVWLEREVLEVGEREQRRIGQDLHDGLCQHLTGTALASQVLAERLALHSAVRDDARRVVELIEGGITLARDIAKGLYPIEMQSDGLIHALENFTTKTSDLFGINCRFKCPLPVLIENPSTAAHLYRIAQEAVSNAIRHGHATEVEVALEESDAGIRLRVSDNGVGMPDTLPSHEGMGLRTMADRAGSIGGQFSIHPGLMAAPKWCASPRDDGWPEAGA
jgi:signal transduction histidine kinase